MGEVTSISSDSTANGSNIRVRMTLSADLNSAILEAREKVDLVRHRLPDDIERVDVLKFSTQDFAAIEVSLMSTQRLEDQYDFLTKQLKMPLERIAGVGRVDLHLQQPRVWIELDHNLRSISADNFIK